MKKRKLEFFGEGDSLNEEGVEPDLGEDKPEEEGDALEEDDEWEEDN